MKGSSLSTSKAVEISLDFASIAPFDTEVRAFGLEIVDDDCIAFAAAAGVCGTVLGLGAVDEPRVAAIFSSL